LDNKIQLFNYLKTHRF